MEYMQGCTVYTQGCVQWTVYKKDKSSRTTSPCMDMDNHGQNGSYLFCIKYNIYRESQKTWDIYIYFFPTVFHIFLLIHLIDLYWLFMYLFTYIKIKLILKRSTLLCLIWENNVGVLVIYTYMEIMQCRKYAHV